MTTFPHSSVFVWLRVWIDLVKQGKVSCHQHFHSPHALVWLAFFEKVKDKLYCLSQLQPSHENLFLGVPWVSESIGIVNEAWAVTAVLMALILLIFGRQINSAKISQGGPHLAISPTHPNMCWDPTKKVSSHGVRWLRLALPWSGIGGTVVPRSGSKMDRHVSESVNILNITHPHCIRVYRFVLAIIAME